MKFELNPYHRNTPSEELLSNVRQVAVQLKKNTVSHSEYTQYGKYHPTTLIKRFGSWNKVLEKANLEIGLILNIPNEELFRNIENVWTILGRQPKCTELKKPLSVYSTTPYRNRFGGWQKALKAFVDYINQDNEEENVSNSIEENKEIKIIKKRTKRDISDRLRFKILLRDGFTCRKCGSSPLKSPGIELHVDHIIPWSKGGETEPNNLETKCKKCNLGKGNAFNV